MKKMTAMFLAMVMVFMVGACACAQDAPSEWAVNEVDYGAAEFLKATSGKLDYAKEITREEFATVSLYIYATMTGMEIPEMSVENPFTDCNNPLVVTAYGLGLVKGVSETEFNPTAPVTREQICVMLTRIATGTYGTFDMEHFRAYLPSLEQFADGDLVSEYAVDAVKLMIMAKLIKGTDEGKINPLGNCTVQEALIIAKRAMNVEM